ncbi:MAG TPA: ROK family protein [Ktedonobacteraceae bacterium]|jgi:predicted NBD/HSP70 family sugar kinase|nr:ROK family protein [Ktedonobacteraceae bacterium]
MYIGIDVGGTNTRVGLFPSLVQPGFFLITRFATQQSYELQLHHLISALVGSGATAIEGIGIAFGGRIHKDGRSVLVAPNLPAYVDKPFVQDLERQFHCPVRLAHDPVCGLLGEKKFGALATHDRCAYLTLSTGTGAAFQLHQGHSTLTVSIEIAHQLLDGNERTCLCGQQGCLETFTGGKQLEQRYGRTLAQVQDQDFWATLCDKLALGLVNLVHLTRVETMAISGAMALQNDIVLTLLQEKVNTRLRNASLTLTLADLEENAPLVGAATLLETSADAIVH